MCECVCTDCVVYRVVVVVVGGRSCVQNGEVTNVYGECFLLLRLSVVRRSATSVTCSYSNNNGERDSDGGLNTAACVSNDDDCNGCADSGNGGDDDGGDVNDDGGDVNDGDVNGRDDVNYSGDGGGCVGGGCVSGGDDVDDDDDGAAGAAPSTSNTFVFHIVLQCGIVIGCHVYPQLTSMMVSCCRDVHFCSPFDDGQLLP